MVAVAMLKEIILLRCLIFLHFAVKIKMTSSLVHIIKLPVIEESNMLLSFLFLFYNKILTLDYNRN